MSEDFTVSPLTTCVHITTKRQISTYRNCDLSSSDDISKYRVVHKKFPLELKKQCEKTDDDPAEGATI